MEKHYMVISPDGIDISGKLHKTPKEAKAELMEWVKRYEHQGYYSSSNGRISLSELPEECTIIEV